MRGSAYEVRLRRAPMGTPAAPHGSVWPEERPTWYGSKSAAARRTAGVPIGARHRRTSYALLRTDADHPADSALADCCSLVTSPARARRQ